jgi:hypothetical protein
VGDITGHQPTFGTPQYFGNVAGHALVGCASHAASGGKCGPGALSAAVTAFAGPLINEQSFSIRSLILNTTIGGFAAIAGGGKFANGAVTSAFGYLFNQLAGNPIEAKLKAYAARAVSEFDAMGDAGFTEAQLAAMKDKPYLRPMYRGYNIDLLVRDMVLADRELEWSTRGRT